MQVKTTDSIQYFDEFSSEYDELSKKHAWHSPEVLFGLHYEFIEPAQILLDLGIGTGQSSDPYKKAGLVIDGVDGSEDMLKLCKEKGIARRLWTHDLRNELLLEETYDHIISNGTFYFLSDLEHLFAAVSDNLNPSGCFCFTVEDTDDGVASRTGNENSLISERLAGDAQVQIFGHSEKYIQTLATKYSFGIKKRLEFLAYNSPSEKRDIYFCAYILQKSR